MYVTLTFSVYDNTFSPLVFIFTSFPTILQMPSQLLFFSISWTLFPGIPAILLLLLKLSLVMLLHPWGLYLIYKYPSLPFYFLQDSSFCFLYCIIFYILFHKCYICKFSNDPKQMISESFFTLLRKIVFLNYFSPKLEYYE